MPVASLPSTPLCALPALISQRRRRAQERAAARQLSNCSFQHADAHSLPYASCSIDCIVVSRLFLIVPDKEGIIREIYRVLKPSGRCFIAEPTSGFRTRLPLAVMWLLARLTTSPAGKYREPQQADVMNPKDFKTLVQTQPWSTADLAADGWYQYAVCVRGLEQATPAEPQAATTLIDDTRSPHGAPPALRDVKLKHA